MRTKVERVAATVLTGLGILFAVVPTASGGAPAEKPIVIAHRGASGYLPEHTLAAYAMAYAQGADYIEPDLVLTKDSHFICLHDIHLEDTTNVEEVFPDRKREDGKWYAADFTLEEIKHLWVHERLPSRFPVDSAILKVPTFSEMIELVQGLNISTKRAVGIYPELKAPGWHRSEGLPMEEAFLEIASRYGYEGKDALIFVQCFEPPTLQRLRNDLGSELPQIMLVGDDPRSTPLATPEGLDFVAGFAEGIGPDKKLIEQDPAIVTQAHERGLKVHPYTFRTEFWGRNGDTMEEELAKFFFEYGVDGAFTDFPDKAVSVVERRTP
jgi:glycerophosphoryl diester phosphodiesterase